MNKRLLKRHKRQVSRERERIKLSAPDLRTPDQVKAAREASRAILGRSNDPHANYASRPVRSDAGPVADSMTKGDVKV